mmetsp:Transcript_17250/g.23939  ORF Transcript_17250/g.23939 Transcript_17250/m.23939 type:complete len:545 (+) Transcript_17250:194-1828(+)
MASEVRSSTKPLASSVNVRGADYLENYAKMKKLVDELNANLGQTLAQGSDREVARHLKRGQMLARDRVELVLDEDSPFLELCPLSGFGQDDMIIGSGSVAGIGLVEGVECLITASVSTLKGGSIDESGLIKGTRLAEIAMENHLPAIGMVQSAGANLSQQSKVFHKGGQTFRDLALRSKMGLTTICVVFGSSTAGGAYQPGMSDYTIMVKEQAKVFLGGPPLVKMATGEEVDDETLGGADMHSRVSGVSDYLAKDEMSAIRMAREIMANLNWTKKTPLPTTNLAGKIEAPLYSGDELLGIVPANIRVPFDCREIIARIVDGSRFSEFKPLYGQTLVCGFAHIHGIPVGIIGNNGVLFVDSSNKGTQFIQLCNQNNHPLIFLQNITGFMVGSKYEKEGMVKAGSQFINAVSNSGVPAITIVMGASYGAGNYAMCGRAYKPRFLFSWPNSKCSVMGPDQLTGVMDIVTRGSAERRGQKIDEEKLAFQKEMFKSLVEEQSSVYYTSSRCVDDGVIDPRDTRDVLGICLSIVYNNDVKGDNTHGISRL